MTTSAMPAATGYTNVYPLDLKVNELVFRNGNVYLVFATKMDDDHFAFRVWGRQWDFVAKRWVPIARPFVLPGNATVRVGDSSLRKLFGLGEPYDTRAWVKMRDYYQNTPGHFTTHNPNADWHNDPKHNHLP